MPDTQHKWGLFTVKKLEIAAYSYAENTSLIYRLD